MDGFEKHRSLYKGTTPPWKESYRKRCLDRLKNSRSRLLEQYRQMGRSHGGASVMVQEVMEEEWSALRSEWAELPSFLGSEGMAQDLDELSELEQIQQELMRQEQCIISEFEQNLQCEQMFLSSVVEHMEETVICPVCHKNNLSINSSFISCCCGLNLNTQNAVTPQFLQNLLESSVSEHMEQCLKNPVFSVTPSTDGPPTLMISCSACDFLSVVL